MASTIGHDVRDQRQRMRLSPTRVLKWVPIASLSLLAGYIMKDSRYTTKRG